MAVLGGFFGTFANLLTACAVRVFFIFALPILQGLDVMLFIHILTALP